MLFAGIILNGPIVIVGYSSLLNQMKLAFGVHEAWVITLLILPSLMYVPMSFVTASLYNNLRTYHVVSIAATL